MQPRHFQNSKFKPRFKDIVVLFLAIKTIFLSGCAATPSQTTYVKDGRAYGTVKGAFRHRWWNYYERGLSFAEGEFYREAEADLQKAIDSRDQDQRMARTYGMHFVDYFPHRELGVIYFQQGDFAAAKRELDLSISQFSSAKALYYLDRIRKEMIERKGGDVAPPKLTLDPAQDEFRTREDPVVISGTAEDDHFVSGVSIRGIPLFMESSRKTVAFKEKLALPQGRHAIEIAAKNLPGKTTRRTVFVHVDRQGPVITIDEFSLDPKDPQTGVMVSGSVYDDSGISEIIVSGRSIPARGEKEVFFNRQLVRPETDLEMAAADGLGNRTTARIPLSRASAEREPLMLAGVASDLDGYLHTGLFGPRDTRPPEIKLRDWADKQTVFLENAYLEGDVSDEERVVSLRVNNSPALRREGRSIFFSHIAALGEGENLFLIEAGDAAGNIARKTISITRRVPRALQLDERLSMSILPFEQKGKVSDASTAFQDKLIDALVNLNRFNIVERDRLDAVLQEQKLSRTALFDRRTALEMGRLMAAKSIMTGSIVASRTGIEIVARLIDTETSEILATEDVYDEVKDLKTSTTLSIGMAAKFHKDFPLLDGVVVERKGGHIFTDLGQDKIKLRRRLIVFREEPVKHPVTGRVMGADNVILGRARVTQVMTEMSKAELLGKKTGDVQRLDMVITE